MRAPLLLKLFSFPHHKLIPEDDDDQTRLWCQEVAEEEAWVTKKPSLFSGIGGIGNWVTFIPPPPLPPISLGVQGLSSFSSFLPFFFFYPPFSSHLQFLVPPLPSPPGMAFANHLHEKSAY